MPTYEYRCQNCLHTMEVFQKITEDTLKKCPLCQENTLTRGPGGGLGFSLVGSGWYKTDYASPPKSSSESSACCPCGKNVASCETKAT